MKIRRLKHTIVVGSDEDIQCLDDVGRLYHLIMQAPFPTQEIILTLIEQYLPLMDAEDRLIFLAQILRSIKEIETIYYRLASVQNFVDDCRQQQKSHN